MSLNGLQSSQFPLTLDGLSSLDVSTLTIDGQNVNLAGLVPYQGANQTVDLNSQVIKSTHTAVTNSELVNLGLLNTTISNLSTAIAGSFLDKATTTPQTVIGDVSYTAQLSADDLLVPQSKKASLGNVLSVDAHYIRTETDASITVVQYFGSITSSMGIYQATSTQNNSILQIADLGVSGTGKRMVINMNWNINEPSYTSSIQLFASDNGTTTNQYITTSMVSFTPSDPLYKVMTGTFVPQHRYICAICNTSNPSGVQTVRWYGLTLKEEGVNLEKVTMPTLVADRVAVLNGNKQLVSSGISTTKLDFLDNVSSDIQTQLNSKLNLSGSNANQNIVLGGYKVQSTVTPTVDDDLTRKGYTDATFLNKTTNASQAVIGQVEFRNTISHDLQTIFQNGIRLNSSVLGNWNISVEYIDVYTQNLVFTNGTSGATLRFTGDYGFISSSGWSPSKAMITDSSGQLVSSAVDSVKLTYLNGVTSDIQTQINTKASITYVDQQDALKLNLSGSNANQNIVIGSYKVQSSAIPSTGNDYTNKTYVDSLVVGGTSTVLRKADVRNGVAPDAQAGATMSWYFGTHTNNGVTPYADMMIFNGWTDGSGGKTNMLSFNKGITAGIRQYHGDYGSTSNFSSYRDCVMTDFNSANVTLAGTLSMGSNKVTSTAPPTTNDDLTRKGYVDTQDGLRLLKSGDTATGTIYNTGGNFHPHTAGDLNRGIILFANNADGASYTVYNGGLASWYGIGFKSTLDDITRFVFDTRTGNSAQVGTMTAGGINNTGATANRVAIYDVNKNLVSSGVTDTTLSYLDIGSSLTGLLATKANLSGATFTGDISATTMAIGTASPGVYTLYVNGASYTNGYAYVNGNIYQYGADFNIQNALRGAGGRALVHDVSNILTINYGGDFASVKIDSSVSLGANAITSTSNPTTADQLSRKGYVDGVVANYLPLTGGTLSGALTVNGAVSVGNRFLGLPDASPTGNFWMGLRGTGSEIDRLAISIVGNQTTGIVDRVVISKSLRLSQPTASRVLTLNASGDVTSSSVTDTTLAYLDATSSVQTQLDSKASTTYVDNADSLRVLKAGDVMTGDLSNSGSFISSKFYGAGSNLTYTEASHKNQWWRIMITGPVEDKIYAEFIISYSVSNHHGFIHFRVATCYTVTPYITIIGSSFYGTPIVQKLRLALSNSDIYADGYVEMFLGNFDWTTDNVPIRVNPINQSPFNSAYTITGVITAGTTTGHNYYEVSCDSALEIAGSSTRFRIKEGNVGIGTTNPTSTLHLNTVGTHQVRFQTSHTDDCYITAANDLMALSANLALSSIPNVGRGSCQIVLQTPTAGGFVQFLTGDAINTVPSERMRIAGDGKVGIGSTTPREKLDVAGNIVTEWNNYRIGTQYLTSSSGYFLGMENNVSTRVCAIVAQSADSPATGAVVFRTGSGPNERMRINSVGQVGIGTVSLTDMFQVQGTASFSGDVGIGALTKTGVQLRLSDTVQNRKIVLYDGGFTDDHQYYGFGIMGNTLRFNVPVASNDRFSFFAGTSSTASTEVARINGDGSAWHSGNVGIKTTSPSAPLHVSTSGGSNPNTNGVYVFNPTNSVGQDAIVAVRVAGSSGGNPYISFDVAGEAGWSWGMDNSDNKMKLSYSWNSLTSATRLTVDTTGNVGIGTTSPTETLTVQGTCRVINSLVNADYAVAPMANTTISRSGTSASLAVVAGNESSQAILYLGTPSNPNFSYGSAYKCSLIAEGLSNWSTNKLHFCLNNSTGGLTNDWALSASLADSRMVITNDGKVGIGSTNPLCSLYNYGTGISGWKGMSYFGNQNTGVVVGTYDNVAYVGGHNAALNAWTDINLCPGGNCGIGTNSPSYKLDVNGATNVAYLRAYGNAGGGPSPIFSQNDSAGDAYALMYLRNNSGAGCYWFLNSSGRTGDGGSNTATLRNDIGNLRLQARSNAGIVVRADTSNVGIGTDTPTAVLDVYNTSSDYTNNVVIRQPWAGVVFDNTQISGGRKWGLFSGGSGAGIGTGSLGVYDITANAYRFNITSQGNTMVGSEFNARTRLGVNGGVAGNVDGGQWTQNANAILLSADGANQGGQTSGLQIAFAFNTSYITSLQPGVAWRDLYAFCHSYYLYTTGALNVYLVPGTAGWITASDEREKEDIQDLKTDKSLKRIMALKPKHYRRKYYDTDTPVNDEIKQMRQIGFLAHEVQQSNPHCVSHFCNNKAKTEDDDGDRLGVNYGDLNIHLIGAVQEIVKQNEEQQKRIDTLEAREVMWEKHAREQEAKIKKMEKDMEKLASLLTQMMPK